MKKVSFLLVCFALFLLWSCKKDKDQPVSFPKYWIVNSVTPKGIYRLFYDNKEITDQAAINKFLSDSSTHLKGQYLNRKVYMETHRAIGDTIFTMPKADSMVLNKWVKYNVSLHDHTYTFKGKEVIVINPNDDVAKSLSFLKYKNITNGCVPNKICTGHESFISTGDDKVMQLPVIAITLKYSEGVLSQAGINAFDETFPPKMPKGDTLLIREYVYELKAK